LDKIKLNILTPAVQKDIYIPRNIYLGGNIIHTPPLSDSIKIKENIEPISQNLHDLLLRIEPIQYTLQNDKIIHFDYLNKEIIPENIAPFYLESNPIYISIFQRLVTEIQELKTEIAELKKKNDI
jgi:hypothetical protein